MNNVALIGRLCKEVELRYTTSNTAVCGFTLAVNRRIKQEGQPDADFISIVGWAKTAEFCSKYFKKGQQVWINGRIQTRTWDDNDGKKHYATEVVAEQVGFADSKKDEGQSGTVETPQNGPEPDWAKGAGQQNGQWQQQQQNKPTQQPAAGGQPAWAQGQPADAPAGQFPWLGK